MKKTYALSVLFLLFLFFVVAPTSANSGEMCYIPSTPGQPPTQGVSYPVEITNPVTISSETAGNKENGCNVATVSASTVRTEPLTPTQKKETQANIINTCATAVGLSTTTGGTLDQSLNAVISVLNKDPINRYRLTIKRAGLFSAPPVLATPPPRIEQKGNVEVITYQPYTFNVNDVITAMKATNNQPGGVGMGGVAYDPTSNREVASHMFQPLAIDTNKYSTPNGERQNILVYDPFFDKNIDLQLAWDTQGRMYINLWAAPYPWFTIEDMYSIEKIPPAAGGGGGAVVHVKDKTTPIITGAITGGSPSVCGNGWIDPGEECEGTGKCYRNGLQGNCNRYTCKCKVWCGNGKNEPGEECDPPGRLCTNNAGIQATCGPSCICPSPLCPNGKLEAPEQCDDGNSADGDGCNKECRNEFCGDDIVQTALGEECDDGNKNGGDGCSSTCKLENSCGNNLVEQFEECDPPGSSCNFGCEGQTGICDNSCFCTCAI